MSIEVGDLVALASALGWAGTSVLARSISLAIPALWYNALRITVASVIMAAMLPWTLGRGDLAAVSWTALGLLLGSVLTGFALGDTAFFESMRRLGVARAAPIAGSHPLITALLAVLVLGEPVTLALVVGIVVIGVGVWLITTDGVGSTPARGVRGGALAGVVLALVAAVGWSLSTVLVRPALAEVDTVLASSIRLPFAAAVLLLVASRSRMIDSRRLVLKRGTVVWLLVSGVLTVLSATLFLWSVELVGAARTSALSSVSPIFSAGIAALVLGERLTARLVVGMAISAVGVLGIVVGG
jgi:drug/metabolite transporter (DMT)-like permease